MYNNTTWLRYLLYVRKLLPEVSTWYLTQHTLTQHTNSNIHHITHTSATPTHTSYLNTYQPPQHISATSKYNSYNMHQLPQHILLPQQRPATSTNTYYLNINQLSQHTPATSTYTRCFNIHQLCQCCDTF